MNTPSTAFIWASWIALATGFLGFIIGLLYANMELNEKGYYLSVLFYGLFSAVSLQKTLRDKMENIPVSHIYFLICWFSFLFAILLLSIGLWNASLLFAEKGFYLMSFFLSLYASISVQKNIRDIRHPPKQLHTSQ
ncbi:MAG: inner membrane protein YiaA [Sulfurovum sp.]|nr:inner membrane protein YiaA [Sulfurovum sp.]